MHENNLSKSTLHLAINELMNKFENCSYFPAYEIVIDELRDYRFYKEDMVHPSDQAINYVWDKFSETYFEQSTLDLVEQILKIKNAVVVQSKATRLKIASFFSSKITSNPITFGSCSRICAIRGANISL